MPAPNLANVPDVFWPALGGGIGGGIAILIVEIFRWYVNRPLIRCKASLGFIHSGIEDNTRYLFLEATNPHSQPVTISTFGLLYKKKELGKLHVTPQVGYSFPYQLDNGKSIIQWSDMQLLLKTLREGMRVPQDLKWVYFQASSGKLYRNKIPKWVIKELEREFYKLNESESSNT
ncbi:MAG: hypothetical protein JW790_04935 [Dehalococcoidales bacterium]|nr:hypothetical protein [Dehalococcoidales bacterium]